jgi:hypothetical protein
LPRLVEIKACCLGHFKSSFSTRVTALNLPVLGVQEFSLFHGEVTQIRGQESVLLLDVLFIHFDLVTSKSVINVDDH